MKQRFKIGDEVVIARIKDENQELSPSQLGTKFVISNLYCDMGHNGNQYYRSATSSSWICDSLLDPVVDKKAIPTLQEWFTERMKNTDVGLCSFAWQNKESPRGTYDSYVSAPCHASLGYRGVMDQLVLHYAQHMDEMGKRKSAEEYRAYSEYIFNRSPWASAFVTKSSDDAYKNGVTMDCSVPRDILVTACIALRVGTEFSIVPKEFVRAIKAGASENVAFLIGVHVNKDKVNSLGGGHHVVTSSMSFSEFVKVFETGYIKENIEYRKPFNSWGTGYNVLTSLCSNGKKGETLSDILRDPKILESNGEGFNKTTTINDYPSYVKHVQSAWDEVKSTFEGTKK
jgi:hypothetical protein